MKVAKFIKEERIEHVHAMIFRMDPPYLGNEYIRVSHAHLDEVEGIRGTKFAEVMRKHGDHGETYIFACDDSGKPKHMTELEGSVKGDVSHITVLMGLGYDIEVMVSENEKVRKSKTEKNKRGNK